jgi:hypothetical protein
MGGEVGSKRDKLPAEAACRKSLRVVFEKGRKLSPWRELLTVAEGLEFAAAPASRRLEASYISPALTISPKRYPNTKRRVFQ